MSTKEYFELWLDESGDFENEADKPAHYEPSIVGGVLVHNHEIDAKTATLMLNKENEDALWHATELTPKDSMNLLKTMQEKALHYVIFTNENRIDVTTNNTTYLNILTEGIYKLLSYLTLKYDLIDFKVVIASRKNMDNQKQLDNKKGYIGEKGSKAQHAGIISAEDYRNRIKEKIIIEASRKNSYSSNLLAWTKSGNAVTFADARKDSRLQLADTICNTYLTRNTKFRPHKQELANIYYDRLLVFPTLAKDIVDDVEACIGNGSYSEALFLLYFGSNGVMTPSHPQLLDKLGQILLNLKPRQYVDNIFKDFVNKIDSLLRFSGDFRYIAKGLKEIQDNFIPSLEQKGYKNPQFNLDIALYLYTCYTHMGSQEGYAQDILCRNNLTLLKDAFEVIVYSTKLANRRSIHFKNMFDYDKAQQAVDELILLRQKLKAMLSEINPEDNSALKDLELAKACGTRQQLWPVLYNISQDGQIEQSARTDYEMALNNFEYLLDQRRQHIYFAQSLTAFKSFHEALRVLLKTEPGFTEETQIKAYLEHLKNYCKEDKVQIRSDVLFSYLVYVRIIEAAKRAEHSLGSLLENDYIDLFDARIFKKKHTCLSNPYPYNVLCLLYGEWLLNTNQPVAAHHQYQKVLKIHGKANLDIALKPLQLAAKYRIMCLQDSSEEVIEAFEADNDVEISAESFHKEKNAFLQELSEAGQVYWDCLRTENYEEFLVRAKLI